MGCRRLRCAHRFLGVWVRAHTACSSPGVHRVPGLVHQHGSARRRRPVVMLPCPLLVPQSPSQRLCPQTCSLVGFGATSVPLCKDGPFSYSQTMTGGEASARGSPGISTEQSRNMAPSHAPDPARCPPCSHMTVQTDLQSHDGAVGREAGPGNSWRVSSVTRMCRGLSPPWSVGVSVVPSSPS